VRYFGGTKLGVPGLINAYKTAAREALLHAEIVTKMVTIQMSVRFGYEMMNPVMRIIKEESARVIGQEMGESCELMFTIKKSAAERIELKFQNLRKVEVFIDK
jgi:putative IMPACT (imprinted ancient) family translation regulator